MKDQKKYVVLENLLLPNRGFRFWSLNTDNNTKLFDGTVAYKVVMITDNTEEAISKSQKVNREAIATTRELTEYYTINPDR